MNTCWATALLTLAAAMLESLGVTRCGFTVYDLDELGAPGFNDRPTSNGAPHGNAAADTGRYEGAVFLMRTLGVAAMTTPHAIEFL